VTLPGAEVDTLRVEVDGGVATLTLDQPARLNPLGLPLQRRMLEMLAALGADRSVRVLVLTGAGKAFCVGADLNTMQAASGDRSLGAATADVMAEVSNPLILALRDFPAPTIAAVNGPAAGAGVGLALACDVVIAARSAYFYLPFMPKLGIVPDLGATWFVPRLVGRARATALSLLGDRLTADVAMQWGLIWSAVDDAQLAEVTRQTASRLAALPDGGVQEIRRAFDATESNTLPAQLQYEADRQRELIDRDAFAEGVRAFLEKRAPDFRSR